ncbi:MAG: MCP four helix bundle domain-containing protein, partial [Devosia sp.]
MSIKTRLAVALTALSLVILALSATAFISLQRVNANIGSVVADRVIPLQQLKRIADAYAVAIVDKCPQGPRRHHCMGG